MDYINCHDIFEQIPQYCIDILRLVIEQRYNVNLKRSKTKDVTFGVEPWALKLKTNA